MRLPDMQHKVGGSTVGGPQEVVDDSSSFSRSKGAVLVKFQGVIHNYAQVSVSGHMRDATAIYGVCYRSLSGNVAKNGAQHISGG